jgi:hypothetical protein
MFGIKVKGMWAGKNGAAEVMEPQRLDRKWSALIYPFR